MTEVLPLFPLELVLFPGETVPLHIFEPRYRDLVRDCTDEQQPFGIVLSREGAMAEVGCTASIARIDRTYADGRLDITVVGGQPFRVGELVHERTYLQVQVRPFRDRVESRDDLLRERVITQHMRLLELAGRDPSPVAYQQRKPLSYFIGMNAGLTVDQQQALLEAKSENERIRLLVEHMEAFIPRLVAAEELRRKVGSNGHFPDFPLDASS